LFGTFGGLFYSQDAGDTIIPANGFPAGTGVTAIATTPINDQVMYVGTRILSNSTGRGIYKSLDAGVHWTAANAGMEDSLVTALAVDPKSDQVAYAGVFLSPSSQLITSPGRTCRVFRHRVHLRSTR
jgi:hypothetical protein